MAFKSSTSGWRQLKPASVAAGLNGKLFWVARIIG